MMSILANVGRGNWETRELENNPCYPLNDLNGQKWSLSEDLQMLH